MIANETGQCSICNGPIAIGEQVSWNRRGDTRKYHVACKNTQQPAGNDSLAAVLASSIQPFLNIQRDEITAELEEYVSERITEALANLPKETKTVYIQSGKTIGTVNGHKHEHFDFVLQLVAMRESVYLWGEAGSGKSTAARQMAKILDLPFYYLALQAQMTDSRLMGYNDGHGIYQKSDFYRAYKDGGVFLLDELELGSGNLLGSLNGALANGSASFPCGQVDRHPDFVCIATGNTPALGATVQFSDRRALDGAVRDRFHFVEWNTDKTLELQLATAHFDRCESWVNWVQNVREFCKVNHAKITCTQRASLAGSKMLAHGIDVARIAETLVFRGYDKTSVASILAAHPLPVY
jgi:midasin (ATPase involved in ribosome maturation)